MSRSWDALTPKLHELHDYAGAIRLLHWDQQVMMPPEGAPARARVVATLESAAHRLLTAPEIGDLLRELASDDSLDDVQRASVRVLERDHGQATKVPEELVRDLAKVRGLAYQAWTVARPASDFSILEPHLRSLIELKKHEADALGWDEERYDALLDLWEPHAKTSETAAMFDELVRGLKPITDAALEPDHERAPFLYASYDDAKQHSFCRWLVEQLGFDVARGRLDSSPHPFTIQIGPADVRQTTRTETTGVLGSIYAAIHETGHALYEQGIPAGLLGLPVGRVPSLGMHESQSRLWENQIGRSRAFTDFLLPHLKDRFPEEIAMTTPQEFYRGVNHVQRTLIRVSADELTYNLHVALRFKLELALFRDELEVSELPGAWNDATEEYLGIRPENDSEGVLQDMHWSIGAMGYFPTYTIGNLYAAAIDRRARAELDTLDGDIRSGDMRPLLEWLRENIHRHGYVFEARELMEDVTGASVDARPLLTYLEDKYSNL
ncbi:MAG: carboxypeptidase M32 [Actinomycetota bacterium]